MISITITSKANTMTKQNYYRYSDTESSTYEIETEDVCKDFWAVIDKFDDCEYPENSQFFDKTNKKVIGKCKDEAFGVPITKFVGLRSKMSTYIKEDD